MRSFVFLAATALLGGVACGQAVPSIDFIHVTDTHVIDRTGIAPRFVKEREHYADGERRLAAMLAGAERPGNAAFALITGDLNDAHSYTGADSPAVFGQIEAFQRAIAKSPIPVYLALGNHDLHHYEIVPDREKGKINQSVAGAARAAWIRASDCFREGTYYEFSKQVGGTKYVFLVLDNGYRAETMTDAPPVRVPPDELHWLQSRAAANRDAVIILAMHIPLGADATSDAIRKAVTAAPNIALVLAGHNHRDQVEDMAVGASTTVQVRTAALALGTKNVRRIRLLPDRIEVYKTGAHDQLERTIQVVSAQKAAA